MRFKSPQMESQLEDCPIKLQELAAWVDGYCLKNFDKEIVITRVSDAFAGESGVHPDKRAFDVRDEWFNGRETHFYFSEEEALEVEEATNAAFPRDDDHKTCIYHSFNGGPWHLHFQIPAKWV